MDELRLNKQWRLEQRDDELYVRGGQDAIFTINLDGSTESFFAGLGHSQRFKPTNLRPADRVILEQLLSAGVIIPAAPSSVTGVNTNVKVVGADIKLPAGQGDAGYTLVSGKDHDFLVLVRVEDTLDAFIKKQNYQAIDRPHLFVDLAYEHTVSLGPLVYPGLTACIACLQGRLNTRWGDDKPPPQAKSVIELAGLAAEWVAFELRRLFHDEDYTLVNETLAMDMESRTITSNSLHTVPLCPYCQKGQFPASGKLEYTFGKA